MSKVENILKENFELKKELEDTVRLIKENEAKYQGFKVVQYSMLLSDSLAEVSEKALKYFEEIFGVGLAAMFIREGAYAVTNGCVREGERIFVCPNEAFNYTFLENRPFFGSNESIIHKEFRIFATALPYSFVLVPFTDGGKISGALAFFSEDSERFGANQNFDFINELAIIASISVKKISSSFMLETKAQTDYLTCLPNKSMMEITAARWLDRCKDYSTPFSFMIIDLDNFKNVNDSLGHMTGDDVLMRVARAIRANIGDDDLLGRFGGDEFYLFSTSVNDEDIQAMQSKISSEISKIADNMEISQRLGVSAGVVVIPDDLGHEQTFIDIVRLTDENLYKAKAAGGNKFFRRTHGNN